MKIKRLFTKAGHGPYEGIVWEKRRSEIRNPNGASVFSMDAVIVPSFWSPIASDILAQKYFRKASVPKDKALDWTKYVPTSQASLSDEDIADDSEHDARQVFHRLAYTWCQWARSANYFDSDEDEKAFYDELCYMLAHQIAAPNSPQWFNTGLFAVYGIEGPAQGHYFVDPSTNQVVKSESAYQRPQPHACFILDVKDDLVNEGGIMDLVTREARLFKYGSGTGSNFSRLRGANERLSGGGVSSGLLSFLKIADRSAGAIKSGGTTRRAAKMVILDADHPDVEEFVRWKTEEEYKVACLAAGSGLLNHYAEAMISAIEDMGAEDENSYLPDRNPLLRRVVKQALDAGAPSSWIHQVLTFYSQTGKAPRLPLYNTAWESEAYNTVSGQSSNNSVRVSNEFMEAVVNDLDWDLIGRTTQKPFRTTKARDLWNEIAESAWLCADPGLQFHTTINEWHTCKADGEIRGSNPCSEYMFLDDTACNLASLNLLSFYDEKTGTFDDAAYRHAIRLWTIVLEISVVMAQFPSKEIARKSFDYRTLGLGYANIGSLLMVMGLPYDSDRGRSVAAALSAILTGESYAQSARMAKEFGPFARYEANKEHMLRVIRNHRRAAHNAPPGEFEALSVIPKGLDVEFCPRNLSDAAHQCWDEALQLGEKYGFRNAQVTAIAPTGTIGLLMDCDTTGVEPDFALVKFKKLAGGGYFKIINTSVPPALHALGYSEGQIGDIIAYALGKGTLEAAPGIPRQSLLDKGIPEETLQKAEMALQNAISLESCFSPYIVGYDVMEKLGISKEEADVPTFSLLSRLGYSEKEIEKAELFACGTMSLEGAPHLAEKDLAVFDTATPSGKRGTRSISWQAHIAMMAAVQPFVTGSISKTINMPNNVSIDDVKGAYTLAWRSMLKSIALYRDGSKLSQPLAALAPGSDLIADSIVALQSNELIAEEPGSGDLTSTAPLQTTPEPELPGMPFAPRSVRRALPSRRKGYTQKAKIGGHSIFLRTGEYEDGTLGEIFLDMHKEGAAFRSILNSFAIAVSLGLQYGVPLEEYVDAFTFTRFEPNGMVSGHDYLKMATSVLDYIFRELAISYLHRYDLGQVKPEDLIATSTQSIADEGSNAFESGRKQKQDKQGKPKGTRASPASVKASFSGGGERDQAIMLMRTARQKGYEGDPCPVCGNLTLVRNGTCLKCDTCGSTTGCS
ncbi:MAG: adenosylcobalamin-dependent ribonucleoside-diphosphate reductase [Rectinema sp.]|jgi:ribonucleoside-diphosphate reductase alpha chain|uniref:Vitamin B12-dependent ribonucleotide reductase n=1 Tax=uncultured spirochete TaxID=156406 RepID=A0A3P3XTT7_9SPIR|nr:Vitamin B12-dependent ribonucleotide reductase [uncultured spirochete]